MQMEEAVHAGEVLNRSVLNSIMANIAVVDKHGTIIAVNEGWEKFALDNGCDSNSPNVGVGASYLQVCERAARGSGWGAQEILDGIRGALSHLQVPFRHEYACHTPTEQRWFSVQVSPLNNADGGAVITHFNITERKRAEVKLRESEEMLQNVLETFPGIVFWKDVHSNYLGCNQSFATGAGLMRAADIIGKSDYDLPWVATEAEKYRADDASVMTGCKARVDLVEPQHQADGGVIWLNTSKVPLRDVTEQIIGVLGVSVDITKSKRAEDALVIANKELLFQNGEKERRAAEMRQALATLDATDDCVFIFDPETLCHTYVNAGAVQQLGYTRGELLGMTPLDFKPEFNPASLRELLAPMLRGDVRTHRFTTRHRHKDGHEFPVEINLQYVALAGERPRFIAISRNITERLKSERLAMRSQRLESIGTLAGGLAHDLNNALTPIMMAVDLLRMDFPGQSSVLDMVATSTKHAANMVQQLLIFAKGADGERVPLKPARLVKELEKLMSGSFPKNIELAVQCDPQLPLVLGDATQLHQVLLNLCVNARDAMPNGGTLTLDATSMEVDAAYASFVSDAKPGTYVALRVCDTGTGIPQEILERIFDPFFTTKETGKGTGLGLSTVMGILKGHGGFLQVYSKPGQGSTFTVYLPACAGGRNEKSITTSVEQFHGQEQAILFVDDEATVRKVATAVLRRLNFRPLTATDGANGLKQVEQHHSELRAIITDLQMPVMDGLAFVRALRQILPDIPVVVTSGRMEDSEAAEFKALGVTRRLDKPFTKGQLAEMLKSVLQMNGSGERAGSDKENNQLI